MTEHTYIIAEAGVNHNGDMQLARQLIDVAAQAGADAVKFQSFKADRLVSRTAPKARYQQQHTAADESQYEMLARLELSVADHAMLLEYCQAQGIQFLSTPFDEDSLALLVNELQVPRLKVPSGELTTAPLLLAMARTRLPIIISTGMATLSDIEAALGVLAFGFTQPDAAPSQHAFQQAYCSPAGQTALQQFVSILHCTTEYPAPYAEINLRVLDTFQHAFQLPVGLSDHTMGIAMPLAAVARGARLIEKHFTLDRQLPGPDHQASLEPDELCHMVQGIRQIEQALGQGVKMPTASELGNRTIARKSVVAAQPIQTGEAFTVENLALRRPGTGLSPFHYWDKLGQVATRDYQVDELIDG